MKYYNLYNENKIKDARGNLKVEYELDKMVRGEIITKENVINQQEPGNVNSYSKLFITNRIYLEDLKVGKKIENYLIKQVLEYNSRIVCLLSNI